jgi:hypothetical protein
LLASNVKSDDRPGGVELLTMVPWNAPLPAPGALNVVKVVFRSLAFAERAKPDVARLTANASKSAVPVAVPCNDALFVLLLLFMIFPNRLYPSQWVRLKTGTGESHCSGSTYNLQVAM